MTAAQSSGKGAARNAGAPPPAPKNSKVSPVANPELGAKQICPNCQAKFYDLTRRPAHCPKCDTEFEPEEALKVRKGRGRAGVPDYEDQPEDAEDQVKEKAAEDEDEEEEEVVTPASRTTKCSKTRRTTPCRSSRTRMTMSSRTRSTVSARTKTKTDKAFFARSNFADGGA